MGNNAPTFDFGIVEPKVNSWFETALLYEGQGTVKLTSPKGTVTGPFVAQFGDDGTSRIETVFERLSPTDPDHDGGPIAFLCGAKPEQFGKMMRWSFSGMQNPCQSLSFATAAGTFLSTGKVEWAGMNWGTAPTRLRFFVREGKFETKNTNPPRYFVIPLFNCVAALTNVFYGEHPLRIFPTPQVPNNVPPEIRVTANLIANEKNSVLAFTVDEKLCFIERVPDYEAHLAGLKTGGARRRITAVLVGDMGANSVETLADFKYSDYQTATADTR